MTLTIETAIQNVRNVCAEYQWNLEAHKILQESIALITGRVFEQQQPIQEGNQSNASELTKDLEVTTLPTKKENNTPPKKFRK